MPMGGAFLLASKYLQGLLFGLESQHFAVVSEFHSCKGPHANGGSFSASFEIPAGMILRLAPRIANLPEDVKKGLEDPDSRYNFGWSHGKQKLESGKLAFKALGKLMLQVGLMLAHHWDHYIMHQGVGPYNSESLEQTIKPETRWFCFIMVWVAYGLCIFNRISSAVGCSGVQRTGVKSKVEIPCPDSVAGLYIKTRDGQVVKAPSSENASNVARSTFAMFMQPNWDVKLKFPSEIPYHQEVRSLS
ncbi:hypothetical protein GUJ93_ZPchr0010g10185 [Zizania palustris]|uniref:Uncharacterized protein n=1 Tax=Zizania palustris TaxID=103762 RepID=A0A8J6BE18_ZIZPA|nr:hypothetical protein GUJ93_ZPchr0010g10185 [Zizania palustris]